jgi:protein-disulfide isomerase
MNNENKSVIITSAVVIVSVIVLFAIVFVILPGGDNSSGELNSEALVREDTYQQVRGIDFTENEVSNGEIIEDVNLEKEVTVVTFEDFQCPACAAYQADFMQLKQAYPENVKFVFRHFPLSIHPNAIPASNAAEAAGARGHFYEYHDLLFAKQNEWSNLTGENLIAKFVEYAQEVGIEDIEAFETELEESKYIDKIRRDYSDGEELGVNATPTVFINGSKIANSTFERMQSEIEEILSE